MKKLIILAIILALMTMATAVLAAPSDNSPWQDTSQECTHTSYSSRGIIGGGTEYFDTNTEVTKCFKN